MIRNLTKRISTPVLCGLLGAALTAAAPFKAEATPVTVQEVGIGANEVVEMTSSTLGTAWVYAGIVKLKVDGTSYDGFCIDPFHWSVTGPQAYNTEALSAGPKPPGGAMGAGTALKIEQLWDQYYSPTISSQNAAGLQIAIWELVGGVNFKLDSSSDYGAGSMLSWVNANPNAPAAALTALTGPGQDYVVDKVPDTGATIVLLGFGVAVLFAAKRAFGPQPKACVVKA